MPHSWKSHATAQMAFFALCIDTDECDIDQMACNEHGVCVNQDGGYSCNCYQSSFYGPLWIGTRCETGEYIEHSSSLKWFILHRRRKLFNIGGGANPAQPTSILGGGIYQKYIYACVHMHMYAHTCVKYLYTHACMHTHVCMYAQPMQTYILPTSILWGGFTKSTYSHACICTCMHTHVLNIYTPMHACTHMYACMHSLCKH